MIELIAAAAIKAITSYLVTGYMKTHFGSIEIEGAPYWYGRESENEICISDFKKGGIEELESEKEKAKRKLEKKLSTIISYAIHSNKYFSNLKKDEEEFLNSIINDSRLSFLVNKNRYYKNIKVDKDKNIIFIRVCIDKEKFINYEKERIKNLEKQLLYYKEDKMFNEMEGKSINSNNPEDKAFEELDRSF